MFDDLFDNFGDNPLFQKIIGNIMESMVMQVNNDLKFGDLKINDDVVKATLLVSITDNWVFEFLRTINLHLNGADEIAYGNVNDYLNKLETIYLEGDKMKEEHLKEKRSYGGI